jgi:hypothetical protein
LTFIGNPTWELTMVNTPTQGSSNAFTVTASGEVDLTLPDLPGALTIEGSATFTINPSQSSLDLSLNGSVNLDPLGNLIGLAGNVHFDDKTGTPELYGIFARSTSRGRPCCGSTRAARTFRRRFRSPARAARRTSYCPATRSA